MPNKTTRIQAARALPPTRRGVGVSRGLLATLLATACLIPAAPAPAQTLLESLATAYVSNPTLEAARAELRSVDELVPQQRAGYLPNVELNADIARTWTRQRAGVLVDDSARGGEAEDLSTNTPRNVAVDIVQPLYRGGRTSASVSQAENLVQAQRAILLNTEQNVLLDVITAYLDVVRDQAVLDLNFNNEQVLQRQLEASQDRFRVGEITRTDVSQSESRLSRATSDRIQAQGLLNSSRSTYARLVGTVPGKLVQPTPTVAVPNTLEETVALAEENSPAVIAARFGAEAAKNNVRAAKGVLLPEVTVTASGQRGWDNPTFRGIIGGAGNSGDLVQDTLAVVARVRIPLYQGGDEYSRVREAKQIASQRRTQVDEASRQARENAVRSWESLVTSRASIRSRQAQVRASEIALEGVRQEATVGSRTVLDVLDAEQELLNARVDLVSTQRDELVSIFAVLAATGQLTAGRLGVPVPTYDPAAYYLKVHDKLIGYDTDVGK